MSHRSLLCVGLLVCLAVASAADTAAPPSSSPSSLSSTKHRILLRTGAKIVSVGTRGWNTLRDTSFHEASASASREVHIAAEPLARFRALPQLLKQRNDELSAPQPQQQQQPSQQHSGQKKLQEKQKMQQQKKGTVRIIDLDDEMNTPAQPTPRLRPAATTTTTTTTPRAKQYLIHLSRADDIVKRELLRVPGVSSIEYVPANSFHLLLTAEAAQQVNERHDVLWMSEVDPAIKYTDVLAAAAPHPSSAGGAASPSSSLRSFFRRHERVALNASAAAAEAVDATPVASSSSSSSPAVSSRAPSTFRRLTVVLVGDPLLETATRAQTLLTVEDWAKEWTHVVTQLDQREPLQAHGLTADRLRQAWAPVHVSPHLAVLQVEESFLPDVVLFLSHQHSVLFIQNTPELHTFNSEVTSIVQSGVAETTVTPANRPIWAKNLRGDGQLIGIGDSGVDISSTFLADGQTLSVCQDCNVENFYQLDAENGSAGMYKNPRCHMTSAACTTVSSHRKIAAYWAFLDSKDPSYGHGTHVAGTVGGASRTAGDACSAYNGVAPNAKLVITDLNDEVLLGSSGALIAPPDMYADYFPFSYNLGVRIHTNSWGSNDPSYGYEPQFIDRYVYQNKDMLVLFAAGNSGADGFSSIGAQAQAKNIVSVGASGTSGNHLDAVAEAAAVEKWFNAAQAFNSEDFFDTRTTGLNGQSPLDFLNSNGAGFSSASDAVAYYGPKITTAGYCCTVTNAYINSETSREALLGQMMDNPFPFGPSCCQAILRRFTANKEANITRIASFSSRGPTSDGRIKPDVVAPGNVVISARAFASPSSGTCSVDPNNPATYSLAQKAGTSMATPATAGSAALIRQYYLNGFATCGHQDTTNTPKFVSAALLKATLINSGDYIVDDYTDGSDNSQRRVDGSHPDDVFIRGHGRVDLKNSLRFDGGNRGLFFMDAHAAAGHADKRVATGQTMTFTVSVTSASQPLAVTLTWTDPAPSSISGKALVNDLDLVVVGPDNSEVIGNAFYSGDSTADRVNNVEKVYIATPQVGTYTIRVIGHDVPVASPQDYAVVANFGTTSSFTGAAGADLCQPSAAAPGPVFTTPPTPDNYNPINGSSLTFTMALSEAATVFWAYVPRSTASQGGDSITPPLSPDQLAQGLDGDGQSLPSGTAGSVTTSGASQTTQVTLNNLPEGALQFYFVAKSAQLQPALTQVNVVMGDDRELISSGASSTVSGVSTLVSVVLACVLLVVRA